MLSKISLIIATVWHLKPIQIFYQCWYRFIKPKPLSGYNNQFRIEKPASLTFMERPPVFTTALAYNKFEFLNVTHTFNEEINWNLSDHGKLWNYNLQYCNYLLQEDINLEIKLKWLEDIQSWLMNGRLPLEPYPVSLRIINTIRIASSNHLSNSLLAGLHAQVDFLSKRLEYHLLGNHLLENAFALIMGGAFFNNPHWINKAEKLLKAQLREQIHQDGGHFELSPMYHQIILFRLLELIDWYTRWHKRKEELLMLFKEKASKMLSWLQHMTFSNGDVPNFNDSTSDIAYSSQWLLKYAVKLNIQPMEGLPLNDSGYRMVRTRRYECAMDLAAIGPNYQPGHGHADALSFVLHANGKPIFVEHGTSTYQIGDQRNIERSSSAHNVLVYRNKNQSEVWGGFRVGRRAKVKILTDEHLFVAAQHDGYYQNKLIVKRTFQFDEHQIKIIDEISNTSIANDCILFFHLHPDYSYELTGQKIVIDGNITVQFSTMAKLSVETYKFAVGFNKHRDGVVFKINAQFPSVTSIFIK